MSNEDTDISPCSLCTGHEAPPAVTRLQTRLITLLRISDPFTQVLLEISNDINTRSVTTPQGLGVCPGAPGVLVTR